MVGVLEESARIQTGYCVNQRGGRYEVLSLSMTILCLVFRLRVLQSNQIESGPRTEVLRRWIHLFCVEFPYAFAVLHELSRLKLKVYVQQHVWLTSGLSS
jgi:hypothetical protein